MTYTIYIQYRHTLYNMDLWIIYIYIYVSKDFSGPIQYTYNIDIQYTIWTYESYIYIKRLLRTYTIYIQYRHTIYIQYIHMNYYIYTYTYITGRLRTCSIYIQYRHTIYVQYRHMNYIYIKGLLRTYSIYIQFRHKVYIQYKHMNYIYIIYQRTFKDSYNIHTI